MSRSSVGVRDAQGEPHGGLVRAVEDNWLFGNERGVALATASTWWLNDANGALPIRRSEAGPGRVRTGLEFAAIQVF